MITTRFMHIHVPRTGGSSLRAFLGDIPNAKMLEQGAHLPYDRMAGRCQALGHKVPPAFVFVRNPWSWYVSQWCWISYIGQRGLKDILFPEFMGIIKGVGESGEGALLNFRPLTMAWGYLQADKAQYVGGFEDFENEVVRILRAIMPDLIEQWIRDSLARVGRWRQVPRPNGKPHGDYRQYYTTEMQQWVAQWDKGLIQRFGYRF